MTSVKQKSTPAILAEQTSNASLWGRPLSSRWGEFKTALPARGQGDKHGCFDTKELREREREGERERERERDRDKEENNETE